MGQFELLAPLLRSVVLVAAGYFLGFSLLKAFRIESPPLHRLVCLAVLGLGWLGGGVAVEIPYTVVKEPPPVVENAVPFINEALIESFKEPGMERSAIPGSRDSHWREHPGTALRSVPGSYVDAHVEEAKPSIDVIWLWLAGIVIVSGRLAFSYIVHAVRIGRAVPAPEEWYRQWTAVLDEAGIRRKIPMLVSNRVGPALVRKLFCYVLVVPEDYWHRLSPAGRLAVLRHERSHYLRRDALKSFFVRILALPQWFHPCAWLAVRRFDEAAEWACDEAACGAEDDGVADFAEALVMLHEIRTETSPALLSGFAARKPSHRILRLVQFHRQENTKDSRMKKTLVLCLLTLLFAAGVLKIRFVEKTVAETPIPTVTEATTIQKPVSEIPGQTIYGKRPKKDVWKVSGSDNPERRSEMLIVEKLHEPFSYDVNERIRLDIALRDVSKATDIPIFIDWNDLEKKNVDKETLINPRLPIDMPLQDALDYWLRQHGLVWVIKSGMLNIQAEQKLSDFVIRSHYVGDLLKLPPNIKPGIQVNPGDVPQDLFKPLMDYIETMVAPESWTQEATQFDGKRETGEMMEYFPNLSLVIRQTEGVHDQIVELLAHLRKHLEVQIAFQGEIRYVDKKSLQKIEPFGLTVFNGQMGNITPREEGDYFVKLQPRSGQPVRKDLEAKNEPFLFHVPSGKAWTVQAAASKRNGHDIIKATLNVEGRQPETRVFYASPVIVKEEQPILTGMTQPPGTVSRFGPQTSAERNFINHVYSVTDLVGDKKDGMTEIVELIKTVVSPDSWKESATITPEGSRLFVTQTEEVHAEIVDLFERLRQLNELQLRYEVSILRLSPKVSTGAPEEEGIWKTASPYGFNGQTVSIELDADSAHAVRIRPHESTLLETDPVERKKEILITVPKGGKLTIQGVASEDRQFVRMNVTVDEWTSETRSFRAKPIEVEKKPKK